MQNTPTYKDAGVDTEAGRNFIKKIKDSVHSTHNPMVLGGLGGFSAAFDVSFLKNYKNPVLLSGTDGVGTKLELARLLDIHHTIGIDLVAMCVNDILVSGGKPLFFLDYIACGKLDIQKMNEIVSGIVKGCKLSGAALVGGETAEHPGLMKPDEYDLAGFVVGAVEKEDMITGDTITEGDVLIGLESSGPHSNGFSLLRKLYLEDGRIPQNADKLNFIKEHLMKPTRIYAESILKILQAATIKGMVHITGGGFYENIPRVLSDSLSAHINKNTIPNNYVFSKIQKDHSITDREMFSTFNMGVGYLLVVSQEEANTVKQKLESFGENAFFLGEIVKRKEEEVII
jgi:phosphoribosylformylglycinamidine cyclo-ligase